MKADQSEAEPGWLGGIRDSMEGWFPEAYAQPAEDAEGETGQTTDPHQTALTPDNQQFFGSGFVAR